MDEINTENDEFNIHCKGDIPSKIKPTGVKRRAWNMQEQETLSINRDETLSINSVYKQGLNPVYKQGEKDSVYRQGLVSLENLRGNPLKIVKFLAVNVIDETEIITGHLKSNNITKAVEITEDSFRTALRFLRKNNLISVLDSKPGPTGGAQYKISESLFLELKKTLSINPVYTSISYIINTTNSEIQEIDCSELEHIGFTQQHAEQLLKKNTRDVLQESIDHFAFGLQHNKRVGKYEDPLNLFIGVLRKGMPWVEGNYRSKKTIALEQILEARKADQERIKKAHDSLLETEYELWLLTLTENQKNEIWPKTKKGMPQEVALKIHFKENYWDAIKKKLEI